jgi:hypothetical protein
MRDIDAPAALPVPDPAPAFDDAALTAHCESAWPAWPQGPERTAPAAASTKSAGGPAGEPSQPDASRWPSQFAQVLAETLTGSRPPAQIARWTTEQARRRISELCPVLAASHRPRIRRVIVSSPAADVIEMAMVVGLGTRVRAIAVRLERGAARSRSAVADWCCTAVETA